MIKKTVESAAIAAIWIRPWNILTVIDKVEPLKQMTTPAWYLCCLVEMSSARVFSVRMFKLGVLVQDSG